MITTVEDAQKRLLAWKRDPALFMREVFGAEPDEWQLEVFAAFADPSKPRIGQQACAGPGKTCAMVICGLNFLTCYGDIGHHPQGAAMSVSEDNLRDNMWKEFRVWIGRSPLMTSLFDITHDRIQSKHHPGSWWISARTFPKTATPEEQGRTLSGLHSDYLLYLIDESGAQNPAVLRSAEQGLSSCKWGKIMQSGNPTSHNGMLFLAAGAHRHMWHMVKISADPDPLTRSPDAKYTTRVNKVWAEEQIRLHGRHNPWVVAYIFGEFPPASLNTLLSPGEVDAAMARHIKEDAYVWAQKRLGVDVARFGEDRTVIFPRQGLAAFRAFEMRGARTTDIAARVAVAKDKWGSELELIDDTGHWGHGVIDNLISAGHSPIGIQFHGPAMDPRFKNRRAEMWMTMAEWVKNGGCLPNIPEMVGELTIPQYTFHNGVFQLEDKENVKKRLGRSPDYADALALTFAMPDMPAAMSEAPGAFGVGSNRKTLTEWDPFAEGR